MRNILLLLSIILSFSSCSQNDENKIEHNAIIGTWKLSSSFVNTTLDSDGEWKPVENGYKYIFKPDGTFYSDRFEECTEGTYNLTDVKLTLIYGCPNFSSNFQESPKGTFVESYRITNNELLLSPNYIFCEGCLWKFEKIQ